MTVTTAAPAARPTGPRRPGAGRTAPPGRRDQRHPAAGSRPGGVVRKTAAVPPHQWFAERLLEALTGRRAVATLAGPVLGEAYDALWRLAQDRTDWHPPTAARVRPPYVHLCRAARAGRTALEVTAVVALAPGRFAAIAFRLEHSGTRGWRCTAVEAR